MFNSFLLFTTTAWFLASLLLVSLLVLLFREWKKTGGIRLHHWLLLAFLGWFLLSFAFRQQPYGYQDLIAYSVGPLAYLVVVRTSISPSLLAHRRLLSWTLAGTAALLSLIGLATFPFEHVTRLSSLFRGVEAFSTFPNAFAMLLLGTIPFQAYLSITEKPKERKVLAVVMLFVSLIALFLTFSRGAYIAFVGSGCVVTVACLILWHQAGMRLVRNIVSAAFIILITIGAGWAWNEVHRTLQPVELARQVPLTEDIFGRISDTEQSADQSTDERKEFWTGSIVLMMRNPWFGTGSDGFRFQYPSLQTELLALSTHPHNIFLKLAVENGMPAAFLFMFFLAFLFLAFLRQAWRDRGSGTAAFDLVLLAAFFAAHLHLMTDYNLNAVAVWGPYWLVLILMGSRLPIRPRNRVSTGVDILMGLTMAGILVVSLTSFIQYRFVKSAQAEALSGNTQPLVEILTSRFPRPFQSLAYEEVGRAARDGHLSSTQLAQLNPVFEDTLVRYPSWPELHTAYARLLAAGGKSFTAQASAQYKLALLANQMNDLGWHLEYLETLGDGGNATTEKAGFYHALVSTYLAKLRQNAHLTITSDNPKAGEDIIRLFLSSVSGPDKRKWTALNNEYLKVWRQEREKFQAVFPGTVLPE